MPRNEHNDMVVGFFIGVLLVIAYLLFVELHRYRMDNAALQTREQTREIQRTRNADR